MVENIKNNRGRSVPNQFIIRDGNTTVLQSYESIIAKKDAGGVALDVAFWDYSKTTGKYRNLFLGEKKKETERKIKTGVYKLLDLNGAS